MQAITEVERRNLLWHYMRYEPTIKVNTDLYLISVEHGNWYIAFYGIHKLTHVLEGLVLVTKETWNKVNCGLSMAAVYNAVLEAMEKTIAKGLLCADPIGF